MHMMKNRGGGCPFKYLLMALGFVFLWKMMRGHCRADYFKSRVGF